jgi:hypothetical protein
LNKVLYSIKSKDDLHLKIRNMDFLNYKKFYEQEKVEELARILNENEIEFEIDENKEALDTLYGENRFNKFFFVKLKKNDFAKVDTLLQNEGEQEVLTVSSDHYLYGFTDDELFEILSKPDEWSELDFQLSKKILNERGQQVSPEKIDLLKKERIEELAKPETEGKFWTYIGYISAILGGPLGIFIGWYLSTSRKVLPNGQQVFRYIKSDRQHGRRIWIIGVVMFIFWIAYAFYFGLPMLSFF